MIPGVMAPKRDDPRYDDPRNDHPRNDNPRRDDPWYDWAAQGRIKPQLASRLSWASDLGSMDPAPGRWRPW